MPIHQPNDNRQLPAKFHLSPEFRLVVACSWDPKSCDPEQRRNDIDALAAEVRNWDEVVSLAARHGVVGIFCRVMHKVDWSAVPGTIKDRLQKMRTRATVGSLGQVAELARLGKLFTESGIAVIPLKGVALSQELYGDPCVRNSGDIDILVPPKCTEKAEELLTGAGYSHALGFHAMSEKQKRHIMKTFHHHEYVNDIKGVHVELHWKSYLWSEDQVARLWKSSAAMTWLDAGLSRLGREENILFLADHGARHGWVCLKWLSDLAMLMDNESEGVWLSLYDSAANLDLQRILCQTAVLLEWFYGIAPPEDFRKLIAADAAVEKLALSGASQLLTSREALALQQKRGAGTRMALRIKRLKPATSPRLLLRSVLVTHSDFVDWQLPDSLFWLYVPLRPLLWFKRHYMKRSNHEL